MKEYFARTLYCYLLFCFLTASIPLFIASGKNKRRAASLSVSNIRTQQIKDRSMAYKPIPTGSLKINL